MQYCACADADGDGISDCSTEPTGLPTSDKDSLVVPTVVAAALLVVATSMLVLFARSRRARDQQADSSAV